MKCELCEKEIVGGAKVQAFDPVEPTTMHVFCTKKCEDKWISQKKK